MSKLKFKKLLRSGFGDDDVVLVSDTGIAVLDSNEVQLKKLGFNIKELISSGSIFMLFPLGTSKLLTWAFTKAELMSFNEEKVKAIGGYSDELHKLGFTKEDLMSFNQKKIRALGEYADEFCKLGFIKEDLMSFGVDKIDALGWNAEKLLSKEMGFTKEDLMSCNEDKIRAMGAYADELCKLGFTKEDLMSCNAEKIEAIGAYADKFCKLGFIKEDLMSFGVDKIRALGECAEKLLSKDVGFTKRELMFFDTEQIVQLTRYSEKIVHKIKCTADYLSHCNANDIRKLGQWSDSEDSALSAIQEKWIQCGYHTLSFILSHSIFDILVGPQSDCKNQYQEWASDVMKKRSVNHTLLLELLPIVESKEMLHERRVGFTEGFIRQFLKDEPILGKAHQIAQAVSKLFYELTVPHHVQRQSSLETSALEFLCDGN